MAGGILLIITFAVCATAAVIGLLIVTKGLAILIPIVFGIMVLVFKFTPMGAWLDRHL
jgi:hypothetical protein